MDFNTLDKALNSFKKRPKRTVVILCIMVLIAILFAFLNGYFGKLGEGAAVDDGAENPQTTGTLVDKIKTGDQSSVILGDGTKITYNGVPQAVVNDLQKALNLKDTTIARLLKTLEEKDVALEDRQTKFEELAKQYKELEERLTQRSAEDELIAQAKHKLDKGDYKGAEKTLLQSLERNFAASSKKKKAAAADAFALGSVKELQLDYAVLKSFMNKLYS